MAVNLEFPRLANDKRRVDILLSTAQGPSAPGPTEGVGGVSQGVIKFREAVNEPKCNVDGLF